MSQYRLGPVKGKMNLSEGGRYRRREGEQRRDILRQMMNNPKVHRYSANNEEKREVR